MPRRTLWVIFGVVVVSVACYERADHNRYGRWFAEALETVDRQYLEAVDDQKLFEGAVEGMVRRLDDYSAFLPASETRQLEELLDQQYGGIGIEVNLEGPEKQLTITNPLAGTPAYKVGLLSGDKIMAVDGRSTQNLPLKEIVGLLRGRPGQAVALRVVRTGHDAPLDFQLVRAVIHVDSVYGYRRMPDGSWDFLLPGHERIGYVRINTFGEATVNEVAAALKWLKERQCRGLILDMRNNPGGLLQAAEAICDMFVPEGAVIVSIRGRDGRERNPFLGTGRGAYQQLPLVVLVNGKSASASEIVAGCLQDHERATVVGERTWGKGTVQNVIPLEGGKSRIKLTTATYWRPSGKNIHRSSTSQETDSWGVRPNPDCEVVLDDKQTVKWLEGLRNRDLRSTSAGKPTPADQGPDAAAAPPFDPQLERAVEVLEQKLSPAPPLKSDAA
jgi:carboxyl-terminal processing protease